MEDGRWTVEDGESDLFYFPFVIDHLSFVIELSFVKIRGYSDPIISSMTLQ